MKLNKNHFIIYSVIAVSALILGISYIYQQDSSSSSSAFSGTKSGVVSPDNIDLSLGYVVGDKNAPVHIIEYASFTCPHCKSFHDSVLEPLKRDYIDTGKVAFYYRHYPLDGRAFAASLQLECVPPNAREEASDALYTLQNTWATAQDPAKALHSIFRQFGVSREKFNECLRNKEIVDAINAEVEIARDAFEVAGTPTIFVNGNKLEGNLTYQTVSAAIDEYLK